MIIAGGLAAILVVLGIALWIRAALQLAGRKRAPATIIANRPDSSDSFLPVLTYVPEGGREIEVPGTVRSSPPRYQVGDRVYVVYDPENPYGAIIDRWLDKYLPTFLCFIVAGALAIVAVIASFL